MFGLLRKPRLRARLSDAKGVSDEFAREITLSGRLTLVNEGGDAEVGGTEMMIIAGFRRIPLEVPREWRALHVPGGGLIERDLRWTLTLDAPLRAPAGELYVALGDQKRHRWEWRLPFVFELR